MFEIRYKHGSNFRARERAGIFRSLWKSERGTEVTSALEKGKIVEEIPDIFRFPTDLKPKNSGMTILIYLFASAGRSSFCVFGGAKN